MGVSLPMTKRFHIRNCQRSPLRDDSLLIGQSYHMRALFGAYPLLQVRHMYAHRPWYVTWSPKRFPKLTVREMWLYSLLETNAPRWEVQGAYVPREQVRSCLSTGYPSRFPKSTLNHTPSSKKNAGQSPFFTSITCQRELAGMISVQLRYHASTVPRLNTRLVSASIRVPCAHSPPATPDRLEKRRNETQPAISHRHLAQNRCENLKRGYQDASV